MGSSSVRHPCSKCLRIPSRGCFQQEALCLFYIILSMLTNQGRSNDIARITRNPIGTVKSLQTGRILFSTMPTAHTACLEHRISMRSNNARQNSHGCTNLSRMHKRKLAETLPRVSLPFGTLTLRGTVPCSSDTWDSEQMWVKLVLYLYN